MAAEHSEDCPHKDEMVTKTITITELMPPEEGFMTLHINADGLTLWDRLGLLEFAVEETKEKIRQLVRGEYDGS